MPPLFARLVAVLCVAATSLAFTGSPSPHARPYSAHGTAQFVSPTDFVGSGQATHLGNYSEVGSVAFAPTGNPAVLAVSGSTIYTAANGDDLHAHVDGTLDVSTGMVAATLTYVGGTGRFANASGSSNLAGQMQGGGALAVAVAGSISY
ncbi:MAG TPA: hypothetical protein VFZ65_18115 [Planctomycetota bacterium]|nr:hypothetical protein [Planctomycetota bacterium]